MCICKTIQVLPLKVIEEFRKINEWFIACKLRRSVGEIKFVQKLAEMIIFLYNCQCFDISNDTAERLNLVRFLSVFKIKLFLLNLSNKCNKQYIKYIENKIANISNRVF